MMSRKFDVEMFKAFMKLFLRILIGVLGITAIYYGVYNTITKIEFNYLWLVLGGTVPLFFTGISCGWLELSDNLMIGVMIKVFNYIAFGCFVYMYLNYGLTGRNVPYIFLLLGCSIVVGLITVYVSIITCMYGMSVIINSDLHVVLKVILSGLEYIAIFDLITLIVMGIYLHIKDTKERSIMSNEV